MNGTGGVPQSQRIAEVNGERPREVERSPSIELIEETPRGFAVRSSLFAWLGFFYTMGADAWVSEAGARKRTSCSDNVEKRTINCRTRSFRQRNIKHRRTITSPLRKPPTTRAAPHPPAQKPPIGRPSTRHLRALCKVPCAGAPSGAAGGGDGAGDIGAWVWAVGSAGESVGKKGRGGEEGGGKGFYGEVWGEGFSCEGVTGWTGGGGVGESYGNIGAKGTIGPGNICVACADEGTETATGGVGFFKG